MPRVPTARAAQAALAALLLVAGGCGGETQSAAVHTNEDVVAAVEGLKRLTAHAVSGDVAEGLAMERDILGGLYRSETGQRRVREFAGKSAERTKKAKP